MQIWSTLCRTKPSFDCPRHEGLLTHGPNLSRTTGLMNTWIPKPQGLLNTSQWDSSTSKNETTVEIPVRLNSRFRSRDWPMSSKKTLFTTNFRVWVSYLLFCFFDWICEYLLPDFPVSIGNFTDCKLSSSASKLLLGPRGKFGSLRYCDPLSFGIQMISKSPSPAKPLSVLHWLNFFSFSESFFGDQVPILPDCDSILFSIHLFAVDLSLALPSHNAVYMLAPTSHPCTALHAKEIALCESAKEEQSWDQEEAGGREI